MALSKRITKEIQKLESEPVPGISATPHDDNLRYFDVVIAGPPGSPYEGGIFKLELFLTGEYPMAPPKVRFFNKNLPPKCRQVGKNLS
mmetsp:Transcript_16331/g.24351  ORF Transcript_16331/g.24351 Transcript_16331/m.24351 type:complete len:88 (-) Transcript_16331:147-410(-)